MKNKVVIVDSDPDCLEIFCEFFQQQGFHVIKIENIRELLNFIKLKTTDLIITDADFLFEENESFINFVEQKIQKIPVLFLTEKNKLKLLKKKMIIQQNRVIEKPVHFVNLLNSVNKMLNLNKISRKK
jgi:DNA-binding NtrC family response regulator